MNVSFVVGIYLPLSVAPLLAKQKSERTHNKRRTSKKCGEWIISNEWKQNK